MLLSLGDHTFDITHRAVVIGILNRTPDSFFDQGTYFGFDEFLRKADQLVAEGADALDVGGVKAGPGPEVTEAEELDRVVPALAALHGRFDVPLSVDTWRATVLREAAAAGAVIANDISGFADPDYLPVTVAAGASVVATHIRLAPRVADPEPEYPDGLVATVLGFLTERARRAEAAGLSRERIMVDAGLDLGKTEPQSLELLRASDQLVALGYPTFLSASNKRFLGAVLDRDVGDRRLASVAAHAFGVALGLPRAAGARREGHPAHGRRTGRGAGRSCRPGGRPPVSVHLLRGKDEALLATAVADLVHELLGDADRALVVDEFDGEEYDLATAVASARTPPFLSDRRVVVVRNLDRFTADEQRAVTAYLADPLDSTDLVVATAGAPPKHLVDALKKVGVTARDTDAPTKARDRKAWFDEQLALRAVRLDPKASALMLERLGEDVGRLTSVLATLEATFGEGHRLGADDIEPFLGDAGSVPPWDLTDAIDRGDTEASLVTLRRMLRAGDRHPLQVMAVLHGHYTRVLRLDGAGVRDEREAAAVLGGAPFQARKALDQLARLGHEGVVRAFAILAGADMDLRGVRDLPGDVVLEVAVARLSRLVPSGRRPAR